MPAKHATWEDVLAIPEDGNRYEAIGGVLYVTPAPTLRHQWISGNMFVALRRLLMEPGIGYVFDAPIGVEFPVTEEGVQPDIIVISRSRAQVMVREGIRGAPDIVVEILSPSTAKRDRTIKKDLYDRQGVSQYWLIDPDSESVDVWDFAAGAEQVKQHSRLLPVRIGGIDAGEIEVAQIFRTEIP